MARSAPPMTERPGGTAPAPAGPDYKELWFSLMRFRWRSLGVMPASAGASVLPVAKGLAEVGGRFRPRSVALIPAEQLDLEAAAQIVEQLMISSLDPQARPDANPGPGSPQTIVALAPVIANPMVIPLVMALDAILVVVEEGVTRLHDVRQLLEMVGRERVLGTLFLRRGR